MGIATGQYRRRSRLKCVAILAGIVVAGCGEAADKAFLGEEGVPSTSAVQSTDMDSPNDLKAIALLPCPKGTQLIPISTYVVGDPTPPKAQPPADEIIANLSTILEQRGTKFLDKPRPLEFEITGPNTGEIFALSAAGEKVVSASLVIADGGWNIENLQLCVDPASTRIGES